MTSTNDHGTRTPTPWPQLRLSEWEDTRDTLHLWTQVVGKVRLALAPMVNHWWQVPLYVSARGLTTSLMHTQRGGLEIEFDFVDHALLLRTSGGDTRMVTLEPRTVASFYDATMTALRELDVHVSMLARPVEIVEAIPFADDDRHRSYDAAGSASILDRTRARSSCHVRIPGSIHRQSESRALLLGRRGSRSRRVSRAARPNASGRRAELRRLGHGSRVQPRAEQLRLLARR